MFYLIGARKSVTILLNMSITLEEKIMKEQHGPSFILMNVMIGVDLRRTLVFLSYVYLPAFVQGDTGNMVLLLCNYNTVKM